MTEWLKQSTSVTVVIGPIWSTSDGSLKSDLAYNASGINCDVYKNGTKADVTLANSAGDGYFRAASGEALYLLTLSTGHTDTLGRLEISLSATGYYMKPRSYMVVPANVWDSMFGADYLKTEVVEISGDSTAADNLESYCDGTTPIPANVTQISGDATAADNCEADYDGTGYAKTASTTKLHSDYDAAKTAATQTSVDTIDSILDAIGATGTGLSAIPWNAAWDAEVQSECADALNAYDPPTNAEMEARTLPSASYFDPAADTVAHVTLVDTTTTNTDMVSAAPSAASVADAVWDEALSGHTDVGSAGAGLAAAGSVGDPWSTALPGSYGAGTAGKMVSDIKTGIDSENYYTSFVVADLTTVKGTTDKLDTAMELDDTVYRFTTNALEQASGTGATAQQVWEYETRTLTAIDEDSTTLDLDATIAAAVPSAASIKTAIEAAGSHLALILEDTGTTLDTLIKDIPTNAELTTALSSADDAVLAAIAALTEAGVKKNTALSGFTFYMTDAALHTKKTGLTVTAERSLDGAAFAACANEVTELSDGCYKINLADTDLNGDVVALKFTASGADDLVITIRTSA